MKFESRLPFLGFRCTLPVEGPDNAFEPVAPPNPAITAPPTRPGRAGKKAVVPF
jgi:hypothetical protein